MGNIGLIHDQERPVRTSQLSAVSSCMFNSHPMEAYTIMRDKTSLLLYTGYMSSIEFMTSVTHGSAPLTAAALELRACRILSKVSFGEC